MTKTFTKIEVLRSDAAVCSLQGEILVSGYDFDGIKFYPVLGKSQDNALTWTHQNGVGYQLWYLEDAMPKCTTDVSVIIRPDYVRSVMTVEVFILNRIVTSYGGDYVSSDERISVKGDGQIKASNSRGEKLASFEFPLRDEDKAHDFADDSRKFYVRWVQGVGFQKDAILIANLPDMSRAIRVARWHEGRGVWQIPPSHQVMEGWLTAEKSAGLVLSEKQKEMLDIQHLAI